MLLLLARWFIRVARVLLVFRLSYAHLPSQPALCDEAAQQQQHIAEKTLVYLT